MYVLDIHKKEGGLFSLEKEEKYKLRI